jgi:hypothetical protein
MSAKNKIDPNLLIKVGAVVAGYFVIVKPLLEFLGLKSSKDDTAAAENIENFKGWNPRYYLEVSAAKKPTTYITTAGADKVAKLIEDSFGGILNDKEEQVYGALRLLKNQVQLSQVAHRYYLLFNNELAREIQTRFSDSEFMNVVNIVNKLPAL